MIGPAAVQDYVASLLGNLSSADYTDLFAQTQFVNAEFPEFSNILVTEFLSYFLKNVGAVLPSGGNYEFSGTFISIFVLNPAPNDTALTATLGAGMVDVGKYIPKSIFASHILGSLSPSPPLFAFPL